jgi:hypothetical protein
MNYLSFTLVAVLALLSPNAQACDKSHYAEKTRLIKFHLERAKELSKRNAFLDTKFPNSSSSPEYHKRKATEINQAIASCISKKK